MAGNPAPPLPRSRIRFGGHRPNSESIPVSLKIYSYRVRRLSIEIGQRLVGFGQAFEDAEGFAPVPSRNLKNQSVANRHGDRQGLRVNVITPLT